MRMNQAEEKNERAGKEDDIITASFSGLGTRRPGVKFVTHCP